MGSPKKYPVYLTRAQLSHIWHRLRINTDIADEFKHVLAKYGILSINDPIIREHVDIWTFARDSNYNDQTLDIINKALLDICYGPIGGSRGSTSS